MSLNGTSENLVKDRPAVQVITQSEPILGILERLKTVALAESTVLLIGETGVGKDLFAEYLHQKSVRRFKPLVKVGVATLPRELVESELFGHEKGAFTGAALEKKGLFEVANGGSIFLDEIDDLPIEVQPKLLRAIESHEVQRVGGTRLIPIDVRFIVASKVSLKKLVDEGKFRADLFYRLNVVPIEIPPLRDRREDIPLLANHFLKVLSPEKQITVSKETLRALLNYSWPGNVRELINVLRRATLFANGEITIDDLPTEIKGGDSMDMLMKSCSRCFLEEHMSYDQLMTCLETNLLRKALEIHEGNKSRAAKFLGLKPSTFRDKLAKHHLADSR
jgi:transcriptional regulator with GAF, ATPase, and Fis domain